MRPSYEQILTEAPRTSQRFVTVEPDGDQAIVRMDDPALPNALSAPLTLELREALTAL
jgi:enoyl-CoA hydratase/carnithine racemase